MSAYFDSLNRRASAAQIAPAPSAAPAAVRPSRPTPAPLRQLSPGEVPSEYAAMRERLLVLSQAKPIKLIVFAGCEGAEGCSQVVRSFAEVLASSGLNVLLVEMAQRTVGPGPTPPPGVVDMNEALDRRRELAGTAWGNGKLTVVQCPMPAYEKERLLGSPQFAAWLDAQRTAFDYLLLDAPAVVRSAEATVIGRMADGIVLVVEADVTPRQVLAKARGQMEGAGVRVLGAVLNRMRERIPPLLRPYLPAA